MKKRQKLKKKLKKNLFNWIKKFIYSKIDLIIKKTSLFGKSKSLFHLI